jgi:hypothetical protein
MAERSPSTQSRWRIPLHWVQALRGKSTLFTQDEALSVLGRDQFEPLDPDEHPFFFEPTVGYCSRCGEARTSFYTCRDGGETIAKEACAHEWEYMERELGETYTGYCERCVKCGEIVQVPQ